MSSTVVEFLQNVFGERIVEFSYDNKIYVRVKEFYEDDLKKLEELKDLVREEQVVHIEGDKVSVEILGKHYVIVGVSERVELSKATSSVLWDILYDLESERVIHGFKIGDDIVVVKKTYEYVKDGLGLLEKYEELRNVLEDVFKRVERDTRAIAGRIAEGLWDKIEDIKIHKGSIEIHLRNVGYEDLKKVKDFNEKLIENLRKVSEEHYSVFGVRIDCKKDGKTTIIQLGYEITEDGVFLNTESVLVEVEVTREYIGEEKRVISCNLCTICVREGEGIEYVDVVEIIKNLSKELQEVASSSFL